MIKNMKELLEIAKKQKMMKLAVAAAQDEEVLTAVSNAYTLGLVEPVLVGDEAEIKKIAEAHNINIKGLEIINSTDLVETARIAVKLVSDGKANFLMKGLLDTPVILKAVLDKEIGLKTENHLSHTMLCEIPKYHKLVVVTDGGMTIAPSLDEKKSILKNALTAMDSLGYDKINVACLAANEKANEKMPCTMDAVELVKMAKAGEFGSKVVLEGPLAMDLAISKEAAKVKKFDSQIAGDVDVMLVPSIEVGNILVKGLVSFADTKTAGVIMGAKAPIVLVSRSDDHETKLYSIAFGSVIAAGMGK